MSGHSLTVGRFELVILKDKQVSDTHDVRYTLHRTEHMTNLEVFSKDNARAILTQKDTQFPVDFDKAWQWLEYNRKSDAKKSLLKCGFQEGTDFNLRQVPQVRLEGSRKVERQVETIHLTIDCFKQWAMMSGTEVGKLVRLYFLECEKELKKAQETISALEKRNAELQGLIASYKQQAERILARVAELAAGGEELDATLMREVHELAALNKKASVLLRTGKQATPDQVLEAQKTGAASVRKHYLSACSIRVIHWVRDYSSVDDLEYVIEEYVSHVCTSDSHEQDTRNRLLTDLQLLRETYYRVGVQHEDMVWYERNIPRLEKRDRIEAKKSKPTPIPVKEEPRNEYDDMLDELGIP